MQSIGQFAVGGDQVLVQAFRQGEEDAVIGTALVVQADVECSYCAIAVVRNIPSLLQSALDRLDIQQEPLADDFATQGWLVRNQLLSRASQSAHHK